MRSKKRETKRIKRNRMMIGALTIFVMLGGGLGIFASNIGTSENSMPYNDFMFELTERGWRTNINNERLYFLNHPLEVEYININQETINLIKNSERLLLSFNPNSIYSDSISSSQFYLSENLRTMGYSIGQGFNVETEFEIPIINCSQADKENIVIIYQESDNLFIEREGYCIIANSNLDDGFNRISSRILFGLFEIIN